MVRRIVFSLSFAASAIVLTACQSMAAPETGAQQTSALTAAIASPLRTPANVERDPYRHPAQTLAFFNIKPTHTVVEIWPGGGWYSEILAPYLAQGGGTYIAAASDRGLTGVRKLVTDKGASFANVRTASFPILAASTPASAETPVPAGSADVVLTFRNVHNWMMGDKPFEAEAFKQMYAMLKPGGTLGVVEHRLPESADDARQLESGYVKVSTVRRLAEAAGFKLAGSSEINANPKDTKDYADG
ncbi:MAG: class I SAM-dependent methyltransferase, partial [Sphingomonas sp.]|nr:class I SAM-dependent methyltransferase [Sphingomonas sp.]